MSGSTPDSLPGKGQSKAPKLQQLGRYRLVARLGQGGMGVVYKAVDTLDRTVALKVLSPQLASNRKYVDRFLREARSAAALNHPNIVGALDVGQEGNYYYFAMEFVDGVTVKNRLKAEHRLSEGEAINIVLQVARALQHAASKNIIHRDIKPENIMISKDGEAKLADMGLAKATDSTEATITQAGSMIGTPQYASPEQIRGEVTIDPRTDIYSLGMTLFHMVVGKVAFDGETAAVVNAKHLNEPLPDIKAARPDLSDGLCSVIQRMCEKDVAKRYQSPDQLIEDLELVRSGNAPKHAGPALPRQLLRRPVASRSARQATGMGAGAIAGIVGAVAIGAAAIFFMAGKGPSSTPGNITVSGPAKVTTVPAAGKQDGPLIGDGPKQDAKTALEAAKKFAEANPGDLGAIVNLFSSVLKFQGTSEAKAAQAEIDTLNAEVQSAFDEKEREVMGYMARSAYGDALMSINMFPEKYQFGAWDGKYVSLKERCEGSIETAFKKVEEGVARAIEAENFPLARQTYREMLAQFPPAYTRVAEKALEDVEVKEKEYQDRMAVQKTRLYKAFLAKIEGHQKTRDYSAVLRAAETAAADPGQAILKPALEMEAEHAKLLARLLELAGQGAAKRVGKNLMFGKLGPKGMTLTKVENGQLTFFDQGGPTVTLSISKQLKTGEIMDIAKAELTAEERQNVMLGAFHFAEGDAKSAKQYWETAAEEGEDVSLALEKLEMISMGEKELEAQGALARVRSSFGRKKWEESIKLIGDGQTAYKDTQTFSKAGEELAEMLQKSKENLVATATEKGGEEETSSGSSARPGRERDGLEQYTNWAYLQWPTGSGTGTTSFGGLKGDDEANRVVRFRYHNVTGKIFVGRESPHDFSKGKQLAVRIQNPSDARVMISLALCTGPNFEYYESPIEQCVVRPRSTISHRFWLTTSNYKCAASNWNWTSKVLNLQDVRRAIFVVHPEDPDGELVFEYIGLEK